MALSQAQYLLMLAEDAYARGNMLAEEIRQKGLAHAREVAELSELIDRAKEIIEHEKARFASYAPPSRPAEVGQGQPPRIVRKTTE
jgi:hypothetical protein